MAPHPKVLHITGEDRSGSTILTKVLGEFNGLFAAGEVSRLWETLCHGRGDCGCGSGISDCAVWQEVVARVNADMGDAVVDPCEVLQWQHRLFRFHQVLAIAPLGARLAKRRLQYQKLARIQMLLYRSIAEVTGARVIVDSSKLPSRAAMIAQQSELRPYILHLVRDPRATAFSQTKVRAREDRRDHMPVVRPATAGVRWVVRNLSSEAVRLSGSPYLRIRYRDFARDPSWVIDSISRFLEEPVRPIPVGPDRTIELSTNHTVLGNPNRFTSGPTRIREDLEWQGKLKWSDRIIINAITAPLLLRYGFPFRVPR